MSAFEVFIRRSKQYLLTVTEYLGDHHVFCVSVFAFARIVFRRFFFCGSIERTPSTGSFMVDFCNASHVSVALCLMTSVRYCIRVHTVGRLYVRYDRLAIFVPFG